MLQAVKETLRISHTKLDFRILEAFDEARAEMARVGISAKKTLDEKDKLITRAIKTYCLWQFSNDQKIAEGYENSWNYQLNNIRKTVGYAAEKGSDSDV